MGPALARIIPVISLGPALVPLAGDGPRGWTAASLYAVTGGAHRAVCVKMALVLVSGWTAASLYAVTLQRLRAAGIGRQG